MTAEDAETLKAAVSSAEDKRALERLARKSQGQESSPAALGEKFFTLKKSYYGEEK
ncbi:MAG: hypothetical protein JSW47_01430 [Phycisphaerales bacterium]|nr:MAG: hypothetical protein JSW47_01430 [Phycisphaerales bacterium]